MVIQKPSKLGSLTSTTVYGFDLDKRELEIQDYDFFIPKRERTFTKGFRLKVVNPDIIEVKYANLRLLKAPFPSIEDSLKSPPIPESIAEVIQEKNCFTIKIHNQLTVSTELAALLCLRYRVSLRGNGSRLQYWGSVQPSDYSEVKEYLNMDNVSKKVIMEVFSCRPFEGWFFDASNPIAFPDGNISKFERVERFAHDFNIELNLKEWERARYFGIFVE